MTMRTGENEMGLKKIIDLTRMIAIVVLLIHCYYNCYHAFKLMGWTSNISDQILKNILKTGLLSGYIKSKIIALIFLFISLLGVRGRKDEKSDVKAGIALLFSGLIIYFLSGLILLITGLPPQAAATAYILLNGLAFILIITGGSVIARSLKKRLSGDIFNKENETFPQQEKELENEFSINLPAYYYYKNQRRNSNISFVSPARGLLCVASPGAGKSRYLIEPAIRQLLAKNHAMVLYDFKYPDLSIIAYNHYLKNRNNYRNKPSFYVINFDDLSHSHRCNPLFPEMMHDISDAVEAARILMLGTNPSWLKKQGDFFVESAINFTISIIWFLRKYEDGRYCTLPHVIELMQVKMDKLFTVLQTEPEISAYISPFVSAFVENTMEQLEGQVDAAKIGLARLSSPTIYYVLSGNHFTLDVNNPDAPKILCLANNPQKQQVFGPILSLFMTRISKIMNQPGKLKSAVVLDEFPTLTFLELSTQIASARSHLISTILAMQSDHQLRLQYGKEWADVVLNICGNIMIGQTSGELAKQVSERLGKTMQDRESISINSGDTSISRSKQLEMAVPVSTISNLSSGEFVGITADTPEQPIDLKRFHAHVKVDSEQLKIEKDSYLPIPIVKQVTRKDIMDNFAIIKQDAQDIVDAVLQSVLNDPSQEGLIVKK
ncbi:Type IV secretory system Conjugative DNA transfer [Chitinophaga jiangningensis]|uniref:Type IV secretory system Conjugative DNA transfer n=1 Tax=Chitinophaga jiangningensis TaxID=1419482 RepID=A0A1M6Y0D4_9BACT|nr:conjugal transfer protein MobC [Chitinophaga jiangningensis]SHL11721.1 Type IV secretory system Conjugative DNA transfer [Chitinophaga jiangningensis]